MVSTTVIVASVAAILTTLLISIFVIFYKPLRKWFQKRNHHRHSYQNTLQSLCRSRSRGSLPYTRHFHPSLESIPENQRHADVEKGLPHRKTGKELDWPGYHDNTSPAIRTSDLEPPGPAHLSWRPTPKRSITRGSFKSQHLQASTGSRRTKSNRTNRKLVGTKKEYRFQRKKLALTGNNNPEPMTRISEESSRPNSIASKELSLRHSLREMVGRLSAGDGRPEMIQVRRGYADFGHDTADDIWPDMIESSASNSGRWRNESEDEWWERDRDRVDIDLS